MFQRKFVAKIKTHYCSGTSSETGAVYGIMWENIVEWGRPQMAVYWDAEKMRFSCRISKARKHTHTHTHIFNILLLRNCLIPSGLVKCEGTAIAEWIR
jgi:hypothetical protein